MFFRKKHADKLEQILQLLQGLTKTEERNAMTLDDIKKDVEAETTLIAGVGTLIKGLKDQIAAAIPTGTLTAEQQAEIDAIFATAEANKAALAGALQTNTPAA